MPSEGCSGTGKCTELRFFADSICACLNWATVIFGEFSDPTEAPLDRELAGIGEGGNRPDGDIEGLLAPGERSIPRALGGAGEIGRTGRNDLRLNESRVSCVDEDGMLRSSLGASLVFVGLEPRLKTLIVLEVRISGVFGTGSVCVVRAGGRLGTGSPIRKGGSCGAMLEFLEASFGRDCEEPLLPNALNNEDREGGSSKLLEPNDKELRGLVGSWSGAVPFRLKPGTVIFSLDDDTERRESS